MQSPSSLLEQPVEIDTSPQLSQRAPKSDPVWLQWRSKASFGWAEAASFTLFCATLAFAISIHVPWSDESHAWLIAHDSSLWQIFRYRLHYEGSPMLWHIFLRLLVLAHVPWLATRWISGAVAAAGVFVLLRWSPFPRLLRCLLPLTFFFQYQYAAIARSYVFFPLLLFTLCILYTSARRRVLLFALTAGLLINLSLHGAIVASALTVLYAGKLLAEHRRAHFLALRRERQQLLAAGALVVAMSAFALYTAIPASDISFAIKETTSQGLVHAVLKKAVGEMPYTPPPALTPSAVRVNRNRLWEEANYRPPTSALRTPIAWFAWESTNPPGGLGSGFAAFADNTLTIVSEMNWPISRSSFIASAFLALWILWLYARGALRFAVPWLVLLIVSSVLWVSDHHAGLFFITLIACTWIAAASKGNRIASRKLDYAFLAGCLLIAAIQVRWTVVTLHHELESPYDPSQQAALYLQQHPVDGGTAAFHFNVTALQPYFDRNPFFNLPTRYWLWSSNAAVDDRIPQVLATHPARVVLALEWLGDAALRNQLLVRNPINARIDDEDYDRLIAAGYLPVRQFCGTRYSRDSNSSKTCLVIFQPGKPTARLTPQPAHNPAFHPELSPTPASPTSHPHAPSHRAASPASPATAA